ncbi:transcription elongation factor GreB [Pseudidiomarina piscicola]|nr:transcription elongation factor GreB [Pseudidiomarina piscicola]
MAKTNLITRHGYLKLQAELDHLWRVERRETTEKVAWAASLGDRSENADYKYNKQKLRQIDRRIRFLRKRLETLKIVDYAPSQEGKVFFGATVTVENDDGTEKTFSIVGPDEIYDDKSVISIDAPMARAALGKQLDDEVRVTTPSGVHHWYITAIRYQRTKPDEAPS